MVLARVFHEDTTFEIVWDDKDTKLSLTINGVVKHVFTIIKGLTTRKEMLAAARKTINHYKLGKVRSL